MTEINAKYMFYFRKMKKKTISPKLNVWVFTFELSLQLYVREVVTFYVSSTLFFKSTKAMSDLISVIATDWKQDQHELYTVAMRQMKGAIWQCHRTIKTDLHNAYTRKVLFCSNTYIYISTTLAIHSRRVYAYIHIDIHKPFNSWVAWRIKTGTRTGTKRK